MFYIIILFLVFPGVALSSCSRPSQAAPIQILVMMLALELSFFELINA